MPTIITMMTALNLSDASSRINHLLIADVAY